MDSCVHQMSKRRIDHSLPFDTALAGERLAFDPQAEVTLARGVVAAMAVVLLAVVDQIDARG